jgi:hypothetical protein
MGSAFCANCGTTAAPVPPPNYGYGPPPSPYAIVPVGQVGMVPWRCMTCGYTGQAMIVQKISTGGWITFAILLATCLPLFWIGLLIKEPRCQCPNCRTTY